MTWTQIYFGKPVYFIPHPINIILFQVPFQANHTMPSTEQTIYNYAVQGKISPAETIQILIKYIIFILETFTYT